MLESGVEKIQVQPRMAEVPHPVVSVLAHEIARPRHRSPWNRLRTRLFGVPGFVWPDIPQTVPQVRKGWEVGVPRPHVVHERRVPPDREEPVP